MADTVSKAQVTDTLAEGQNLSKKNVKAVVEATFEHISEHLKRGNKVQVTGFGEFEVRDRQAR
jgi:DNA-binding protein HU-beta